MNQQPYWKIHIGVHKTATTHLQDRLKSQKAELQLRGLVYISRAEARQARITKLLRKEKFNAFLPPFVYLNKFQTAALKLAHYNRADIKSILISDENLLGCSRDLLYPGPRIYPHLEKRLKGIELLSKASSVEIYLSIRSYDSLLVSAYCQCLRQGWGKKLPPLDTLLEQFASTPPNWLSFLSRIQRQIPQARIRFWKFEDYIVNNSFVLQSLTGNSTIPAGIYPSSAPASTSRLSRQCVRSILELNQIVSPKNYRQALAQVLAKHEKDKGSKFDPLKSEAKDRLRSLYKRDLAEIHLKMPDVAMKLGGSLPVTTPQ